MQSIALALIAIISVVIGLILDFAGLSAYLGVHPLITIFCCYVLGIGLYVVAYSKLSGRGES